MVVKLDENVYQCPFCNKIYTNVLRATGCEQSHDIIYFPIVKGELENLIKFIYSKDENLISENLYMRLNKYLKGSAK